MTWNRRLTPEGQIKNQVRQYLRAKGWFVFHVQAGPLSYIGVSDLIAVKCGIVAFIEIKGNARKADGSFRCVQSEGQKAFQDDLSTVQSGAYEVEVDTGPNLKTQRQEAAQVLAQMGQSNPAVAQLSSDLLARSLDFEYSDELADRLEASLPPEIRQLKDQKSNEQGKAQAMVQQAVKQVQDQAMQAFQAAEAKIQALQQQVDKATQAMNDKSRELELRKYEIDEKMKVEREKINAKKTEEEGQILQQVHALAVAVEHLTVRQNAEKPGLLARLTGRK